VRPVHRRNARGKRAGLVEENGVQLTEGFQIDASFDDRTMLRCTSEAPRMASGVPAAMPQAPATMMTEMVECKLCVSKKVKYGKPNLG